MFQLHKDRHYFRKFSNRNIDNFLSASTYDDPLGVDPLTAFQPTVKSHLNKDLRKHLTQSLINLYKVIQDQKALISCDTLLDSFIEIAKKQLNIETFKNKKTQELTKQNNKIAYLESGIEKPCVIC